jgi:hypothetical protein
MMAWIALIAVILAAFHQNVVAGVFLTITLVPAAIWTSVRAGNRRAKGLPMSFDERYQTYCVAMFATWFLVISSLFVFGGFLLGAFAVSKNAYLNISVASVGTMSYAGMVLSHFVRIGQRDFRRELEIPGRRRSQRSRPNRHSERPAR